MRRTAAAALVALAACGRYGYDTSAGDPDGGFVPADAARDADLDAPDAPVLAADGAPDARLADAALPPDAALLPDAAVGCTTGCPTGVGFGNRTGTVIEGGNTGTAFTDLCPAGQVVIGFDGGLHAPELYVGSIRATCGTIAITPGTLAVTVTPAGQLALHGADTTNPWSRHCGTDEIVVGFGGRSGLYVDALAFVCAQLGVTAHANGTYTLDYVLSRALPAVGGTGGGPFSGQTCPNGGVAVGDRCRSGDAVDAFGLLCSVPTLTF